MMKSISVLYDKLLVRPDDDRKYGGLYLPDSAIDKKAIGRGVVLKTGRGYPMVNPEADTAVWDKAEKEAGVVRKGFLPLSVKPGNCILFFKHSAVEVEYDMTKYLVIPENAVVLVEADSSISAEVDDLIKSLDA